MLSQWPTVLREGHLDTVAAAMRAADGQRGVVVIGDAGVGKTTLARNAVKRARGITRWVAGTETAKGIPLGAFAHLVELSDRSEPHAVLRAIRDNLLLGSSKVVIGVDDAHLLDQLSASVVHQLATERVANFVVTVRLGRDIPEPISALWREGLLSRVDLAPFTRAEVIELVETVLDGPLESVSADRLFRVSQGSPLFLRHLVEGAIEAGNLRCVAGIWQLRGATVINQQLSTLVESRLKDLDDAPLAVVELLAFGGTLDSGMLHALRDPAAVEVALQAGLAKVIGDAPHRAVVLTHPIYGEVIRNQTGTLKARRIRGELVGAMSATRPAHVSDRIRLAALALDSDRDPDVASLVDSGGDAITLGDLELGERLARRALQLGGGFRAALVLAQALSWHGKAAEAEAVLAGIDPDTLDELDLVIWATTRAANLFWMCRDDSAASALLAGIRERLTFPGALDFVEMWNATFTDRLDDAERAAQAVLASVTRSPVTHGWAAFTAASVHVQCGRIGDVSELVARGLRDASQSKSGLLRFNLGLIEIPALLVRGEFEAAELAALRYVGYAIGQQPARAKAGVLLGQVHLERGRLAAARREFVQAIAALDGVGYAWEFLAAAFLCQTSAALGQVDEAADALARAEVLAGDHIAMFAAELEMSRAWLAAAQGRSAAAIAHVRHGADTAAQSGRYTVEADGLFTALRFGDRTVAPRLAELAKMLDVAPARMQADHAAALAADDGSGLAVAAALWERMGALVLAAEAAAQSAVAYGRSKNRRAQQASSAIALRLAAECDGAKTPALIAETHPLPLTAREREISALVALGMSNKDIADQLAVSVRTVEGHVYRACMKLDAADRDGLARAIKRALG